MAQYVEDLVVFEGEEPAARGPRAGIVALHHTDDGGVQCRPDQPSLAILVISARKGFLLPAVCLLDFSFLPLFKDLERGLRSEVDFAGTTKKRPPYTSWGASRP